MSTTTPNLSLTLYDSTTDQVVTFATFRAVWGGTATTSNFYRIDTWAGTVNSSITTLQNQRGAIPVSASFISANYYESTVSSISSYVTGMTILLKLDTTSNGTVTLNINSLGTKSVTKVNASGTIVNIAAGELTSNRLYLFEYDGTQWVWVNANSADQIYTQGTSNNFVRISSSNMIEDSGFSNSSFQTVNTTIPNDGWISNSSTWSYSSVDSPTGIISVNADMTSIIQNGDRIKYTQSQSLTAYWTFNTNSNSDVGSFNGTDTSMTYTAGKFSNAATFNGTTSKIVLTDSASLKPTGSFIVGGWIKTSTTGATQVLYQSYSANTNRAGFQFFINTSNVISARIGKNTGTTTNIDSFDFSGVTNVCDNSFHYVVMTYRNNFLQLYVDGKLESFGYTESPAYGATNYVRVGCGNVSGTDISYFNGQIDDLFFINGYALDGKTILDKYLSNTAQGTGSISVVKMGIITNVGAYSGGNTLLTFYSGTDYDLVNSSISSPAYSHVKSPYGFPTTANKWTVIYASDGTFSQASPVNGTWYNLGGSISMPIGMWKGSYSLQANATAASATTLQFKSTLSNANNTESSFELTTRTALATAIAQTFPIRLYNAFLNALSKTTLYLNVTTEVSTYTSLNVYGGIKISLETMYL